MEHRKASERELQLVTDKAMQAAKGVASVHGIDPEVILRRLAEQLAVRFIRQSEPQACGICGGLPICPVCRKPNCQQHQ